MYSIVSSQKSNVVTFDKLPTLMSTVLFGNTGRVWLKKVTEQNNSVIVGNTFQHNPVY